MDINIKNIAVFIDFENLVYQEKFDPKVLIEKLKEKGRLIVKKAYADWGRFKEYKKSMMESSIELTEMPSHGQRGKNSSDIKLVVDALETAITKEYIDTIVVVSGDSDYTPLISKLREYNKYVIVVADRSSVSELLKGYCDELIYYSTVSGEETTTEKEPLGNAFDLLVRAINLLERDGIEPRGSQVKSMMRQLDSSFNESNYGFSQFKLFLEQANREGIVSLTKLEHGDYRITLTCDTDSLNRKCASVSYSKLDIFPLIYWAFRANLTENTKPVSIDAISTTIRSFDPNFDFNKYGYSKNKGFKAIMDDAERKGFIRMIYQAEKNKFYAFMTPLFQETYQHTVPPEAYQKIKYHNMIGKYNFVSNISNLNQFVRHAQEIFDTSISQNEKICTSQLYDRLKQLYENVGNNRFSKLMNSLLKSDVIRDQTDKPIRDINNSIPIYRIEDIDINSYIETVRRELELQVPEEGKIDPNIFASLFGIKNETEKGEDQKDSIHTKDVEAIKLFYEALKHFTVKDLPINLSRIHEQMKQKNPQFDITQTSFKKIIKLSELFQEKGRIVIEKKEKGETCITQFSL